MIDEDFRFDRGQWRSVVRSLIDVPQDADVRVVLDSSPTANDTSDRSALVAGYITPYRQIDGQNELTILDFASDRWKGIALADATIDFCSRVIPKPSRLLIEHIAGTDLLKDTIILQAASRNIAIPEIRWINPASKVKGQKSIRIMRLQQLLNHRPPVMRIKWQRTIEILLDEVENFVPSYQNRGRQINILDAIALMSLGH